MTDNWRKSSRSTQGSNCVEVALGAVVGVRDTKDRLAGQLTVSLEAWHAFVASSRSMAPTE